MKKNKNKIEEIEMLPEYDFSGGIRGKYAARLAEDNGYIKLDPKIIKFFKKPESINGVLLSIINSITESRKSQTI